MNRRHASDGVVPRLHAALLGAELDVQFMLGDRKPQEHFPEEDVGHPSFADEETRILVHRGHPGRNGVLQRRGRLAPAPAGVAGKSHPAARPHWGAGPAQHAPVLGPVRSGFRPGHPHPVPAVDGDGRLNGPVRIGRELDYRACALTAQPSHVDSVAAALVAVPCDPDGPVGSRGQVRGPVVRLGIADAHRLGPVPALVARRHHVKILAAKFLPGEPRRAIGGRGRHGEELPAARRRHVGLLAPRVGLRVEGAVNQPPAIVLELAPDHVDSAAGVRSDGSAGVVAPPRSDAAGRPLAVAAPGQVEGVGLVVEGGPGNEEAVLRPHGRREVVLAGLAPGERPHRRRRDCGHVPVKELEAACGIEVCETELEVAPVGLYGQGRGRHRLNAQVDAVGKDLDPLRQFVAQPVGRVRGAELAGFEVPSARSHDAVRAIEVPSPGGMDGARGDGSRPSPSTRLRRSQAEL